MSRRVLVAALALVLGVVAGGAAYEYLHNIQQRAYRNASLVQVYRVQKTIPQGTPASVLLPQHLVSQAQVPQQFRPTDAVTSLSSLQGELTAAPLSAGQVLDASQFTQPVTAANNAPSAQIPHGDVAISVSVDSVHGVAGLIHPGDRVDILIEAAGKEQYLYQHVAVLAVGASTASLSGAPTVASANTSATTTTTTPTDSGLITFAVPPDAAQRIALAQSQGGGVSGSLYLALVPSTANATPAAAYAPVQASNLIPAKLQP